MVAALALSSYAHGVNRSRLDRSTAAMRTRCLEWPIAAMAAETPAQTSRHHGTAFRSANELREWR